MELTFIIRLADGRVDKRRGTWQNNTLRYTVNKGLAISRPQPGCHLPNFPWPGKMHPIPVPGRFGHKKSRNLVVFYTVHCKHREKESVFVHYESSMKLFTSGWWMFLSDIRGMVEWLMGIGQYKYLLRYWNLHNKSRVARESHSNQLTDALHLPTEQLLVPYFSSKKKTISVPTINLLVNSTYLLIIVIVK